MRKDILEEHMATATEQRVCSHCEEMVHEHALSCPYCGTPQPSTDTRAGTSLEPPYRLVSPESTDHQSPPYGDYQEQRRKDEAPLNPEPARSTNVSEDDSSGHLRPVLIPASLLLSGAVFFLFGLVLLLFSQDGVLTLHWNGGLWPVFLLSSLPLLLVGWRALQRLEP